MDIEQMAGHILQEQGVSISTMVGLPCIRYQGDFVCMFFPKEESLIVKLAPDHVKSLIAEGIGAEFNYTGKAFKEWVMIPLEFSDDFESYISQSLDYVASKKKK